MTYTNALQVFFERLNYKHSLKGDSFLEMSAFELTRLLQNEYDEWLKAKPDSHEEIEELLDVMICCTLKIEKLLRLKL